MKRLLAVALVAIACAGERGEQGSEARGEAPKTGTVVEAEKAGSIEEMPVPAGADASGPFLFAANDGLLLSWLEPVPGSERTALRFARWQGSGWSEARTVVEREDLFVNWADFPSIAEDGGGTLFVHWLQKSGAGTYAYDVRMASSQDGGTTWGEPFLLNRDGRRAEHGFVSLVPLPGGGVGATWLDGRNMTGGDHDHGGGGDMTMRYATVSADGTIAGETQLDARTCECCTTGMALAPAGPVIAYRDRSPGEIRDISLVRQTAAGWTEPATPHEDGWKIDGCPVNGPQVAASGERVVTAWFTAPADKARAYAAFSSDGGATFGAPVTVDDGSPLGRVDVVMLDPENALVTWLEHTGTGAEIRARRVSAGGKLGTSMKIADSSTARASGFPRMARHGAEVWFAWTEQSETEKKVRVARLKL